MSKTTKRTTHHLTWLAGLCFAGIVASFSGCSQSATEDNGAELNGAKEELEQAEIKKSFRKEGVDGEATLSVTIDNISKLEGTLSVALYDNMHNYDRGGSARGERIPVSKNTHTVEFVDLPMGEYAIRILHDINSNQEMDTNSFGIPTEPFAFSNNAKGVMGPASWQNAKFSIDKKENSHAISFED